MVSELPFETVRPTPDGRGLVVLDQTLLPREEAYVTLHTLDEMAEAIRSLRVRGAPLLGVVAALALAARAADRVASGETDPEALRRGMAEDAAALEETRPTAVNLAWGLERMRLRSERIRVASPGIDAAGLADALGREARAVRDEDRAMCRAIGEHAQALLPPGDGPVTVLTHCNAGALATAGIGTALAPVYVAHRAGRRVRVFADETRPLLQGARLTAWELARAGIEVTVLADGMAGALLARTPIDAVVVGADRIAANGDVANKVGTYGLAVLARRHGVPFYVLAPSSTLDPDTPTGAGIPIEERDEAEIRRGFGPLTVPEGARVWNPAFDVTPAALVDAWVTDRGITRSWT